jgi:hypothetical protein
MVDPRVRIGHCCPDAPSVDVAVDGETAFQNVQFEEVTDYATVPAGSHEVTVTPSDGDDAVIAATVDLAADTSYTALATGTLAEDDLEATVLVDDPGSIAADQCHARFVHAAPDAPSVDVRVAGGSALFENAAFRQASDYAPVDAGSYDLEVVPAATDEVALSLPDTTFEGGAAVSAIAVGRVADDSLTAILVEDVPAAVAADD